MSWLVRHRNLAIAIGVMLGTGLLILIATIPILHSVESINSKIETKSNELDKLTSRVAILSKLDKNVLKERVSVLDSALPAKKDVLLYLTAIDGLSREMGLTFGGLSLSPGDLTTASGSAGKVGAKIGELQNLTTEIKIRGGQESIYSFMRTIEGVLPLMQIRDLKLSIIGDDQYSLALTLGMLWAETPKLDVAGPIELFGEEEERYFSELASYRVFNPIVSTQATSTTTKTNMFEPYTFKPIETEVVTPQP